MNMLIAINSKYLVAAKVMLTSLFENNRMTSDIAVYLLHSNLSSQEISILRQLIENKYKRKLTEIHVEQEQFETFPISHHFTIETYYRFLAQSILPKKVERVLWLDVDMIVKASIKELYEQNFEDKYLVVCQSINKHPEQLLEKLNLPKESKYFNAGTILFNLKKIRENITEETYFKYIEQNRERITWLGQDVLNAIYNQKVKIVKNQSYNRQIFSEDKFSKDEMNEVKDNTAIIHYIGPCKPWDFRYQNGLKKYYWRYALKSEGLGEYIKYMTLNTAYMCKRIFKKV